VPRKPQPLEPWELAYVGDNILLRYCKTISFFIGFYLIHLHLPANYL